MIGSAGVSAVPMAARVSNVEGQKAKPGNFLLMHAMGPNVAGVIGSAIAAGVFMADVYKRQHQGHQFSGVNIAYAMSKPGKGLSLIHIFAGNQLFIKTKGI